LPSINPEQVFIDPQGSRSLISVYTVEGGEPKIECELLNELVGERGFEPPIPWSRTRCLSPGEKHSVGLLRRGHWLPGAFAHSDQQQIFCGFHSATHASCFRITALYHLEKTFDFRPFSGKAGTDGTFPGI
jgi:hypothetical protein